MNYTRILVTIASAAIVAAGCDTYDGNQDPIGATGRQGATLRAIHDTGTRTDFDGKASAWTDGDALSVICTGSGMEAQVYKFTVTDPANGIFKNNGAVLDPDTEYDVYAVYPYNADKVAIGAGSDDARFGIGAAEQTQHGSSASHIAALDPLTGCVKAVTPDNISLVMHHTATAISIRLANGTGESISGISSLMITAPEGIILAASHSIDLADGTVVADEATISNSVEIAVESSGEIPAGGEFTVWAAAAPFSIEVTERTASLSGTSMRQTRYEDCLANPEGFITFMHFERREAHFAAGQWRTLRCHGHLSVSYDPQGRVVSMRHAYQDGTGRSGKGRTTYEWEEDGKLSSVVTDLSRMGNLYESHAVSIFRYAATEDAGATANGGLYWEEPDACPFVYDFMWYAGLFGRPLGRMPVEMLHERLGDGGNRKTISTLSVKRDSLGRAVEARWGTFRFNLFYFTGIILMDVFAMIFFARKKSPILMAIAGTEILLLALMQVLTWFVDGSFSFGVILFSILLVCSSVAAIVVYQSDFRNLFLRMSKFHKKNADFSVTDEEMRESVNAIVTACQTMAKSRTGALIVIGVMAQMGLQVIINIGVVTNTLPNTGIPLPFISYGGTSVSFLLCEVGLILSVSRSIKFKR